MKKGQGQDLNSACLAADSCVRDVRQFCPQPVDGRAQLLGCCPSGNADGERPRGSAAAGCWSRVRDSSSGGGLTKTETKERGSWQSGVDESTKLEVNLTSNHSSVKFSEAGEGRPAAAGEHERRGEMLRKR